MSLGAGNFQFTLLNSEALTIGNQYTATTFKNVREERPLKVLKLPGFLVPVFGAF